MNTYDCDLDSILAALVEGTSSGASLEVSGALQNSEMDQHVPVIDHNNGHQNWEPVPYQDGCTYNDSPMQYNAPLHCAASITISDGGNFSVGQTDYRSHQTVTEDIGVHSVNGATKTRKRRRTAFTIPQMIALEKEYRKSKYIDRNRRLQLAHEIRLSEKIIKIWFQNQRMKHKREMAEHGEAMPIGPDPILNVQQNNVGPNLTINSNATVYQLPQYSYEPMLSDAAVFGPSFST